MKPREITSIKLLHMIAEWLELETGGKLIVLFSKSKRSVTLTQARGKEVIRRWRVHVTEEE